MESFMLNFHRFLRPFAAALAALATLSFGGLAAAKAPVPVQPALWQVSDADTTIYLFGTIHLLPEKYDWRSAKFDRALDGSQELVLETIVDDKNPVQLMSALSSLAFSPGQPPLAQRVPAAKRAQLEQAVKKSGIPPAALDRMETWAAAFMLIGTQFKDMGLKTGEGVETVLRNKFVSEGKTIGELETNVEQLGYFDRLPEKAQRELLQGAIEKPVDTRDQFNGMISAWTRGDVDAIAKTFNKELEGSPELENALLTQRNSNWNTWIKRRLGQPGAVMVAVGAGHLAGDGSVIELLRKDGLKVRRIQ